MLTALLTVLALVAFAANSILCRLALRDGAIDAASFSTIRIAGGALALALAVAWTRPPRDASGSWTSAFLLFLYAVPFSLAYSALTAATGALILFGCVQLTMIAGAFWRGERSRGLEWGGFALALCGLVYLLLPGLSAPAPAGAAMMAIAGVAWGGYSLRGRRSVYPLLDTAGNFIRAVPLAVAVTMISLGGMRVSVRGALLAVASGVLASGFGYVAWYAALRRLSGTRAALVQLSVPVLAAAGGVLLLGEPVSTRLAVSASLVLGGIAVALAARQVDPRPSTSQSRFTGSGVRGGSL